MSVPLPGPSADNPVFGSTKREILLILKGEGQIDLQTLAQHLGISKMAGHKHARAYEKKRLIERKPGRGKAGRPRLTLPRAPSATSPVPRPYARLTSADPAYTAV